MKAIKKFILFGILLSFINSCVKDDSTEGAMDSYTLATITTNPVDSITSYSAVAGGQVTFQGASVVSSKGICYGTSPLPTVTGNNTIISAGGGAGVFTIHISGLTNGTQYFVRAYATNIAGTAYGDQFSFIPVFTIGEYYQGGILFYLDSVTHQHGLIATLSDQSADAVWGCSGTSITGARQQGYGTGAQNTADIVSGCATAGIAARLCDTLTVGGYTDWFLPSYDELMYLYTQRNAVGGFINNYYWSSSENDSTSAFSMYFQDGTIAPKSKNFIAHVRAIRAF